MSEPICFEPIELPPNEAGQTLGDVLTEMRDWVMASLAVPAHLLLGDDLYSFVRTPCNPPEVTVAALALPQPDVIVEERREG